MRRALIWRLGLVVGLASCGPMGTAELTVEFADRAQVAAGRASAVIVTATDEDGKVGSGSIHLVASAGSLAETDAALDAFGRARVNFICDVAVDPACVGSVRLTATWAHQGKELRAELSVTMGGAGGAGGGSGAGGGLMGTGGGAGGGTGGGSPPNCGMAECSNNPDYVFLQTLENGGQVNGWGPSSTQLVSTSVSSTMVGAIMSTCANGQCTRIVLRALDPTYPNAPSSIAFLLGGGTNPATDIGFGGSTDVPALAISSYVNGKRNPPVPSQPYFDATYCGGRALVTQFTVCRLEVVDAELREVLMGFESTCVGTNNSVRGCVHYTR